MTRLLWLSPEPEDPEESFAALKGRRPAPEPVPFSDATVDLVSRRLADVILVDGRNQPDSAAAVIRKLVNDTEASFLGVLSPHNLSSFDWSCGLSDFVTGSCTAAELEVRLARLINPAVPEGADVIRRGEIVINKERFEVKLSGDVIDLTFKEFELLQYLASRPGKVCSRTTLLQEVWGYDFFGGTRTVDVHVRRLRAKLGHQASAIETVRNVGYRFSG